MPLFCGNGEWLMAIYARELMIICKLLLRVSLARSWTVDRDFWEILSGREGFPGAWEGLLYPVISPSRSQTITYTG